ncbi:PREDICTED: uncharacterized protein LOC108367702 [Rhagoletis zephyria]|uniref:uncharacterized protein LOC108367702 n=1 Tax=Rhagoletis zephyria TaxID=28612 RepID=UPI0008114823|nr:PREDICTED: uncharacterized protein LOC108367702 [Rhagoletis zephyria]
MSNYTKLNPTQKDVMVEFMAEHPNLAKSKFSNFAQGRAKSISLWEELSMQLNAVGPPFKDWRKWKKVFADLKYQAKKKLSHNKSGGGIYTEKVITASEELILEAAGLKACDESDKSEPACGNAPSAESYKHGSDSGDSNFGDREASSTHSALPGPSPSAFTSTRSETPRSDIQRRASGSDEEMKLLQTPPSDIQRRASESDDELQLLQTQRSDIQRPASGSDEELKLLQMNLKSVADFQRNMDAKIDKLLETQEKLLAVQQRFLAIKEEKHRIQQSSRETELEIKRLKLETLAMVINNLKSK